MKKEDKQEKFSKSIGYLFFSQILVKILGLFYSLYLINKAHFGDAGNAIYLGSYQIFALVLTFSSIGVPNAVSNIVAKSQNYYIISKVFKIAIYLYVSIGCIGGVILYLFSDIISENFLGIEAISYNLKLLSPIVIMATLESVYIGFFNGIRQMKITAKIQFLEQLIKTIVTVAMVEFLSFFTSDSDVLSLGATCGVSISIVLSLLICIFEKKNVQIITKNNRKEEPNAKCIVKTLLKFSIPISIGAMLVGINKNIDSYSIMNILALRIGKEKAKNIYGVIASKIDVLVLLPLAFNITFSTALIPNISEANRNGEKELIKKYVQKAIFMSLVVAIISTIGLFFFSDDIFYLLFKNASEGRELLKLSSFTIIFSVLNQTFIGILQGFQKNKIPVIASIIGTVAKVFFDIVLVCQEPILEKGVIISSIISNVLMFMYLFYNVKKEINIKIKKYFFMIMFLGLVMVKICLVCRNSIEYVGIKMPLSFMISIGIALIMFLGEIAWLSKGFGIFFEAKK